MAVIFCSVEGSAATAPSDTLLLYCERLGPGLWAEPLNAVSNAAFFAAALAAFLRWRQAGGRDVPSLLLILVVVAIGVGSTIFHTIATRRALLADIVPIAVFIAGYLLLACRRYLRLGLAVSVAVLAAFEFVSFGLPKAVPTDLFNGSVSYLPAFAMMAGLAAVVQTRARRAAAPETAAARMLWLATGLFSISLLLRSLDIVLCPLFPLGTHFAWHCLNAAMLYVLLRAAIDWPRE